MQPPGEARKDGFLVDRKGRGRTFFSMAVYLPPSTVLENNALVQNCRWIYQQVPGDEVKERCGKDRCQLTVAAWCKVDRLYGPPGLLSLQLKLRLFWSDGTQSSYAEDYDPYEEHKWQPLAFSIGLSSHGLNALDQVQVDGWLCAPGGAVFWNDFYLSATDAKNR